MKSASMTGRTLWILWMTAAAAQPAQAWNGCRAADVSGDGTVDRADVAQVESLIGLPDERADLDGDGVVSPADLVIVARYEEMIRRGFREILCPVCPPDFDCGGEIGSADRQHLEAAYGRDCRPDLNRDGFICPWDRKLLLEYLGPPPLSEVAARADLDGNGAVDLNDLQVLDGRIGGSLDSRDCRPDLNRDGAVDAADFWYLLASWGPCSEACPTPVRVPDLERTCDEGEPR